jgi:DNA-binding NtrC family response regulator
LEACPPLTKGRILVVDADPSVRLGIQRVLAADGYDVTEADRRDGALALIQESRPDAVILDGELPGGSVVEMVARVKETDPETACLVLASHENLDSAALAIQQGAEQFLTKPVQLATLLFVLDRVLENRRNRRRRLSERARQARGSIDPFRSENAAVRSLAEKARQVLDAGSPILILGETGTGKGVLASWLHRNGPRAEEPFVDLNCAGLSREFLETELFGHEKGAFTGAAAAKMGLLEVAHRGTLFLDEIGDVDMTVQPKLLKVLEEQRFRRLGDVRDRYVDIRLIAATNQDLSSLVEEKKFRGDLYFRISTFLLRIPPLRERIEDIPSIAEQFLNDIAAELPRAPIHLSPAAIRKLQSHAWPGNIRELRNTVERAALSPGKTEIGPEDLGFDFSSSRPLETPVDLTLEEAEKRLIRRALEVERGRVEPAAERLGISRSSLYQKIQKYGITVSRI